MIRKPFKIFLYLITIFLILFHSAYALNVVKLSPGYFPNSNIGRALSNADIYVGIPDLDPEIVANQKTLSVQQEDGTIVAVTQPISTGAGGVPLYEGSPVTLLVEGDYSLKVLDSNGSQIYYVPSTAYEKYLITGNYYYPDYSEADQGVVSVGSGSTVTDILAEVGAVTKATLYFSHNSGSATTTYTFTTNTTITDNFDIIIEKGVILDGAGTLAIDGAIGAGSYQVFGSDITISGLDFAESVWFSSLNKAVESETKTVHITPNIAHILTTTVNQVSNQTIYGDGDSSLVELGANIDAFTLDGVDNVILRDFKIDGKKATYTTTTNDGINSPANATGSTNITVQNVHIVDIAATGIQFLAQTGSHSENIRILNCVIEDPGAHGICCQDYVDDVLIDGNRIINYGADVESRIGIATGRDGVNQVVSNNYIESDGGAGGASAHGISIDKATYFTVTGNIVTGTTGYGIEVGNGQIGSITGNTTYATTRCGIGIIGDESVRTCKHITVLGNTIFEPATLAGIYVHTSNQASAYEEDITIVGNTIHNSQAASGILVSYAKNGVVSNNTIVDSYTEAIRFESSTFFIVDGNLCKSSNSSDTEGREHGIVKSSSTSIIVNGFDTVDTTDGASSGTGEDTLKTYSIPQETYNDWNGMKVRAAGVKTGANGNKTIKFYIGTSSLTFNVAANDVTDWRFEADIAFHGYDDSDSFYVSWIGFNGTTITQGFEIWAEDNTSAAVTMKVTGECAHADDVITQALWLIEYY